MRICLKHFQKNDKWPDILTLSTEACCSGIEMLYIMLARNELDFCHPVPEKRSINAR